MDDQHSRQRPRVLLYDWDNTLVDGWAGITAALNAAFAAFDKPLWTVEDTRARVRVSLRESFPVMFGDRWEHARDVFYATLTKEHLNHVRPMT
ncbi:MAG TPA: HAD hydrolase-like protein, partial [Acetobacteraceae bacterium]|nr:HAD hydrolase-like protein [Acetobacteraceae bacterium]